MVAMPKRAKMHELRAALLQMADDKSKRAMSHHDLLRDKCMKCLDGVFRWVPLGACVPNAVIYYAY